MTSSNARRNRTLLSALAYPEDRKDPALRENDSLAGIYCQPSTFDGRLQFEKNSFLNERSLNVYENIYNGVGFVKRHHRACVPGAGSRASPVSSSKTLDAAPGTRTMELGRSAVRRIALRP